MLPDFTPQIILKDKPMKIYQILRGLLYAMFAVAIAYIFFLIFFSSENFKFSFLSPNSKKNTIINPRRKTSSGNPLMFDTPTIGKYSRAKISFTISEKIADPVLSGEVKVRKSYEAFLYPEEEPTDFKDGTLLQYQGDFFMVSQNKIRRFHPEALDALGFSRDQFIPIGETDLAYNPKGEDIASIEEYPASTLFKTDTAYYMVEGESLKQFISERAYLSHYDISQAIPKSEEFISRYKIEEEPIGFSDGSLIAYGESAYVVNGKKILPINNPATFEASGYLWEDLIPVNGDEVALYKKGDLFRISSPHPDGTILESTDDSMWYMIKENKKSALPNPLIAQSWIRKTPIAVSNKSARITNQCQLRNSLFSKEIYTCEIPVAIMQSLVGKDYEFSVSFNKNIDVDEINVEFSQDITFSNFKSSLAALITKVRINYANQLQIKLN